MITYLPKTRLLLAVLLVVATMTAPAHAQDCEDLFVSGFSNLYNDWLCATVNACDTFGAQDATPTGVGVSGGAQVNVTATGCAIDAAAACTDPDGVGGAGASFAA